MKIFALLAALIAALGIGGYASRGQIREIKFHALQPAVPESAPNLKIPFSSQAPLQNWDEFHEEFCEEAALFMVHAFYGKLSVTPAAAEAEYFKIKEWEEANLGYWKDTTAEETARILREKYGYRRVEVSYDVSAADIEREVRAGRPVIVPADGKNLNPNFKNGGPVYHNLVIKGFTADRFVTNDPGTRRGADYTYKKDFLMSKIHDWNGGDVPNGRRAMIVVYPN